MTYIESHMFWLRMDGNSTTLPVDEFLAYKNSGDLYAYLLEIGIPKMSWWTTMRLNEMNSPLEFNERLRIIRIPNNDVLSGLLTIYRARKERG